MNSKNYDNSKMNSNFIRKIHLDTTRCSVPPNHSTRILSRLVKSILLFSSVNPCIMMKTAFPHLNLLILDPKFLGSSQLYKYMIFYIQNSYTPLIRMRCEIGRTETLRNIIRLSKPKILHIICHGTQEGSIEFEDNSAHNLGLVNYVKP